MNVKYVTWNYGKVNGVMYHLVRLFNGEGKLVTTEEAKKLKLYRR